jgi:hypothetical protein
MLINTKKYTDLIVARNRTMFIHTLYRYYHDNLRSNYRDKTYIDILNSITDIYTDDTSTYTKITFNGGEVLEMSCDYYTIFCRVLSSPGSAKNVSGISIRVESDTRWILLSSTNLDIIDGTTREIKDSLVNIICGLSIVEKYTNLYVNDIWKFLVNIGFICGSNMCNTNIKNAKETAEIYIDYIDRT